jgi:hypothetical protein
MIRFPKIVPKWLNKEFKDICGQCILYTDGSTEIQVYHGHIGNHGFRQFEVVIHEFIHWVGFALRWNWYKHTFWDCISSDVSNLVHMKDTRFIFTLKYIRGEIKKKK